MSNTNTKNTTTVQTKPSPTNIQVQSSLILLTNDDTIKFLNETAKPAVLTSILDISGNKQVWMTGAGHITTDNTFRYFVLVYNSFVDIDKFKDTVEKAIKSWFGIDFGYSICNIQVPWSQTRSTTTAPSNTNVNSKGNNNGKNNNGENNNKNNSKNPINNAGSYRIEKTNNGLFITVVRDFNGDDKEFTGKTEQSVRDQVNKYMIEKKIKKK